MEPWLCICLFLLGGLFLVKFLYLIAVGCALPVTRGALFIPTSSIRIKTFLNALPMSSEELFLDLGCGDGRILREARRRRNFGSKGVQIRWKNFWEVDLSRADVVFCYLFPDVMQRLAKKLEAELRPGSKVISSNFPLPGWLPYQVLHPYSGRHQDPIYIYRFPNACQTGL